MGARAIGGHRVLYAGYVIALVEVVFVESMSLWLARYIGRSSYSATRFYH